jgi:hypothetical protein
MTEVLDLIGRETTVDGGGECGGACVTRECTHEVGKEVGGSG